MVLFSLAFSVRTFYLWTYHTMHRIMGCVD